MSAFEVIYPRAIVELKVIFDGGTDVTRTQVIPSRVRVTRNSHHTAGTCEIDVNITALTFGQRVINNIFVAAFIGLAETPYGSIVSPANQRFCGYVDVMREKRDKNGPVISLKCRDLSALFRDQKPLITREMSDKSKLDPTPKWNDTVTAAIQRVMKWTGLDDNVLQISDPYNLGSTQLGQAVSQRARTAALPIKRDASAWEAIEHIAAVANILVTVNQRLMVLSPPDDLFGATDGKKDPIAYDFVFGLQNGNVLEVEREKKFTRNRKGVKVCVFDPATKKSITAEWPVDPPPVNRPKPSHTGHGAHGAATKPKQSTIPKQEDDRDIYTFSDLGVMTSDHALAVAKRIYSERSNQELEGSITSYNLDDDMLALANGDRINLTVGQRLEVELRNHKSAEAQTKFLSEQLEMDAAAAQVLLQQTSQEQAATPYYVRTSTIDWSSKECAVHIDFINLMLFSI